jgi:hypothetical protein
MVLAQVCTELVTSAFENRILTLHWTDVSDESPAWTLDISWDVLLFLG